MKRASKRTGWLLISAVCCLLLIGGCRHYEVEVVLNPDGGGSRHLKLSGDPLLDEDISLDEFRKLFHLDEAMGWQVVRETNSKGEKISFEGTGTIQDLASWHERSGDIRIDGSLTGDSHADVGCRNTVVVEIVEGPSGGQYTYKETFAWTGLKESVVAFVSEQFSAAMAEAYPFLGPEEIAELRGLMAGHLALYRFDIPEDEEKEQEETAIASVTFYAREIVARNHPDADLRGIMDVAQGVVEDSDGALDEYIEENLPGVELALFTDVSLRVQMPGPIVETNAEEIEERTAIWKVDLLDAAEEPIELYVRSGMPGH
jgi:hypothetical protein